jgi:uncharacterized protein involved in cysteine biosynthesis
MSALNWIGYLLAALAVLSMAFGFGFFLAVAGAIVGAVFIVAILVRIATNQLAEIFEQKPNSD